MKKLLALAFALAFYVNAFAQYHADPAHSSVNFTIKHMNMSLITGRFDKFEGKLDFTKPNYSDARVNFVVDVPSVNTNAEARDKHLQSPDFFDSAKYPKMRFTSTSFTQKGKNMYALKGNLTIKDVTKPVVFDVAFIGAGKDKEGNQKIGFTATTKINRQDYHITYDPSGMGVGNDVMINVQVEMGK